MSKEDMIKEAVEEAKAEAAKMEDEAAADEQDEAAETKGSVEEEASKETRSGRSGNTNAQAGPDTMPGFKAAGDDEVLKKRP